ncbi:unnamed protein product [Brachionus calyciflorus]|uniref:Uncharacterized protein n=1 Tax=Brachionus calyciflorus TaxID=104777 RepID=A0A813MPZ1_9BILA|nr:unnamed protein product [Brachionus calyciflorus]
MSGRRICSENDDVSYGEPCLVLGSKQTTNSESKKDVEGNYLKFLSQLSTEKCKVDQLESIDHDIHDLIKKKYETMERIEIETKYMAYLKEKIDEATKLKNENDVLMNELKKLNSDNMILEGEYKKLLPEGYKFEKNQPIKV